jgi:hypothetical protein
MMRARVAGGITLVIPDAEAFTHGGYEVEEAHRCVALWRVGPASESLLLDTF